MATGVLKELGALEKQATKQEEVIEAVKANLSEEKKKYESIISDIRSLIRDENSGQEKIQFPKIPTSASDAESAQKGAGKTHTRKRLTDKMLRLPNRKK
jgi:hypothetical protein